MPAGKHVFAQADTGKRPAQEYSITRAGRSALRSWLGASLEPQMAFADDPLRTRILFLQFSSPHLQETA